MASTLLRIKQWDSTWGGLPREIRLLILEALMQDGCTLSRLATVCREWQEILEQHNFARIRLTQWRVVDFDSMTHRNRALVKYIWFCLELDDYDCTYCAQGWRWEPALPVTDTYHCPITISFFRLFSALSTWDPNGDLRLDISIYSPSDARHWFKYLTFLPDGASDMPGGGDIEQTTLKEVFHDHYHGWLFGSRYWAPARAAIMNVFRSVMDAGRFENEPAVYQWWDYLPRVPVVTSLLLRQQNRRRWRPETLAHMFARFPRLGEVHYEPWREWDSTQSLTDERHWYLFDSIRRLNTNLKRLVVFENFNQQYPTIMPISNMLGEVLVDCDSIRIPSKEVGRNVALTSLNLEHLAASFIADASHFFQIEPTWEWPSLTSLVLTSKLFTPEEEPAEVGAMLQAAASTALKMPKLETMEIWNGRKRLAALFKYHASREMRQNTITWRGTWALPMESSVIEAWEAVVGQNRGWRFSVVQERLDQGAIKSHGDAIHYLKLSGQVIRPVSLQQIQMEQRVLEDVKTV